MAWSRAGSSPEHDAANNEKATANEKAAKNPAVADDMAWRILRIRNAGGFATGAVASDTTQGFYATPGWSIHPGFNKRYAGCDDPAVSVARFRDSWIAIGALSPAAGLLIAFALPPLGWWPLAPCGIALWLWLLEGASLRSRIWVGWMVGIGWFGPSTLWMWGLTEPGYPVGVVVGWGPMVAATAAMVPNDRRRFLVLPAALVAYEWLHSHGPFGGVPLSLLGLTQTRAPLLPIARIGGVLLVGGAVSALGVALYLMLAAGSGGVAAVRTRGPRPWQVPLGIVAAVMAVAVAGAIWPLGEPTGSVTIAAVQGGGPQGTRYTSGEEPLVFERHMEQTRLIPANSDVDPEARVDLVVWPENAIHVSGRFEDNPWRDQVAVEAARIGAPIAVGAVNDSPLGADRFENFVVVVNPDGTLGDRFDKVRRVPFGEYVPLRFLFEPIAGGNLPPRDQVPGRGVAVIDTEAGPMAVVVSWEVFFSRRVREGVRAGGQVVLNPTNGSSYWLTQVQTQQIASSQLRALESGRWVVQVSPTGFSAFVDPDGGVHQRSDISESSVLTRTIERYDSTTPAQALGAIPALLCAAIAVAIAQLRQIKRRASA